MKESPCPWFALYVRPSVGPEMSEAMTHETPSDVA